MSAASAMSLSKPSPASLCVKRVESVFAHCFSERTNTRLSGGFDEPLYLPAIKARQMHVLRYREDYFASALHEASHWCIAGPARRLKTDFGYWYAPDGRNESQQRAFENVEYRPQALEWFFSRACGHAFRISVDNLDGLARGGMDQNDAFAARVVAQARLWAENGLPLDGGIFFQALCQEFGTQSELTSLSFSISDLR